LNRAEGDDTSLAVADLLVAALVMPLAAVNDVTNGWLAGWLADPLIEISRGFPVGETHVNPRNYYGTHTKRAENSWTLMKGHELRRVFPSKYLERKTRGLFSVRVVVPVPLAAVNDVTTGWPLSRHLCDAWVSFDVV